MEVKPSMEGILYAISQIQEELIEIKELLTGQGIQPGASADELMNAEQVAEFLNKSPQTIYRYSYKGTIPTCKRGGRLYFDKKAIIQWVRDGKKPTEASVMAETDRFIQESFKRKRRNNNI